MSNQVKISEVLNDLKNGLVRYKKQDKGGGSIQEKYNLSDSDMHFLVRHEKIKNVKTAKKSSLVIIDDTEDVVSPDIKVAKSPSTGQSNVQPIM